MARVAVGLVMMAIGVRVSIGGGHDVLPRLALMVFPHDCEV